MTGMSSTSVFREQDHPRQATGRFAVKPAAAPDGALADGPAAVFDDVDWQSVERGMAQTLLWECTGRAEDWQQEHPEVRATVMMDSASLDRLRAEAAGFVQAYPELVDQARRQDMRDWTMEGYGGRYTFAETFGRVFALSLQHEPGGFASRQELHGDIGERLDEAVRGRDPLDLQLDLRFAGDGVATLDGTSRQGRQETAVRVLESMRAAVRSTQINAESAAQALRRAGLYGSLPYTQRRRLDEEADYQAYLQEQTAQADRARADEWGDPDDA